MKWWIGFSEDDAKMNRRRHKDTHSRQAEKFSACAAFVWQRVEDNTFHPGFSLCSQYWSR